MEIYRSTLTQFCLDCGTSEPFFASDGTECCTQCGKPISDGAVFEALSAEYHLTDARILEFSPEQLHLRLRKRHERRQREEAERKEQCVTLSADPQSQQRHDEKPRRRPGRPSKQSEQQVKRWAIIHRIKSRNPKLKGCPLWKRVHIDGGLPEKNWGHKTLLECYADPKTRNKLEKDITAAMKVQKIGTSVNS
jgi:hypothetical protein